MWKSNPHSDKFEKVFRILSVPSKKIATVAGIALRTLCKISQTVSQLDILLFWESLSNVTIIMNLNAHGCVFLFSKSLFVLKKAIPCKIYLTLFSLI